MEYRNLNGTQKAAILMIALGDKQAPRLLARMNQNDAQRVANAISTMQTVEASIVEQLMDEFNARAGQPSSPPPPPGRSIVAPALTDPHKTNFSA